MQTAEDLAPDRAIDAFDYIMNTPQAYKELGEALIALEKRAKRSGRTPQVELELHAKGDDGGSCSNLWARGVRSALLTAAKDYYKNFPDGGAEWASDAKFTSIPYCAVMRLALPQSDRFPMAD